MTIDWIFVISTAITALAYQSGKLYVRFHDGSTYVYYNIDRSIYERFVQAESKGHYFQENIMGKYAYEELPNHPP